MSAAPRVRLADVAARVGVSIKTVSNVVNDTGWVGPAVRAEVLGAIDELGYRPNLAARQLRTGSSGLIGLCVPNLGEPYFAEFASVFVAAAERRGLTVLITQSAGSHAAELAIMEGEKLPALDGLVISPLALTPADVEGRRSTVPLLLIGEHGEALASETVAHLGPDNAAAAEAATRFLLDDGRRRVVALGVEEARTGAARFSGYRRALEGAGLPLEPELIVPVERYDRAAGSGAVARLLTEGIDFDGLFCFNDSLAFGALYALAAAGIRVPDDVRVVGYDDVEEGRFTIPPLPSIDPGVAAASDRILDLLLGPRSELRGHTATEFALVTR